MVSGFIVDADSEQIAVLKSRGAGRFEILRLYLYEGLILCGIGLIAGPPLSLMICKTISYSDGFLVFNSSQGIDILVSSKLYLYALVTVIILLATLLISVYFASQKSIVEVKSSKNRYYKILFNNKYMDIILLAVALYGYYNYGIKKNVAVLSKVNGENSPVDPLLYVISTIFIIGSGMFLLRLYRYLVNLIFKMGGRKYHTPFYISIINVLRHHLKKSAAMLFIVIAVAIGIFDMYIAKDINTSFINTVKISQGADFKVKSTWESKVEEPYVDAAEPAPPMVTYFEPPYSAFSKVQGIEGFTKVLNTYDAVVQLSTSESSTACILSGIIPHEFGKIAYFDSELLNAHWYNYLNEMTNRRDLILISKGLADSFNYKKGDTLYYKIASGLNVKGVVLDIVDYWPGYSNLQSRNLVVGNFNYIFSKLKIYPYEIWIKKKDGASDQAVYNSIKNLDIELTYLDNLANKLYYEKSDIFLKGTNSILNLSFLAIASIAVLGFIIYWMISLRIRTLSFGIYRSLGISSGGITLTLVLEQFLTLGASMLIGLISGNIVGKMFIPLIKELWYKNKYVIPANNLTYLKEYLQLGMMLLVIFAASFIVLTRYIAKLKINQAIKLGED
jgi:putative ABC transport system permease protein